MSDNEDLSYTLESLYLSPTDYQNSSIDVDDLSLRLDSLRVSPEVTEEILTPDTNMPFTPRDITTVYQDTIPIFDGDASILNAYIYQRVNSL